MAPLAFSAWMRWLNVSAFMVCAIAGKDTNASTAAIPNFMQ